MFRICKEYNISTLYESKCFGYVRSTILVHCMNLNVWDMYKKYNISTLYESKCLGYVQGVQYQYTVRI